MKPKPIDYLFPYPYLYRLLLKKAVEKMDIYERLVWMYFGFISVSLLFGFTLSMIGFITNK